ncbi:RNA polymerase I-specific transcription initiation factor RRN3 [Fistulina hepatica ATCC 64428]|uniref:RNA polymerase I-specific transcription initiation factor RRN3 n=1 Tax=Fistulina hepatica ATCC 64428 TaxID=1128425 RepID=A0A0D7A716_9AGAR|nr:RNA polymerase I-specific transcription initiation factor RRN3 [Fistulina hepatica ATCC 64428]
MDPHSRHSQFNQRTLKVGPVALNTRYMDPMLSAKPSLDQFTKQKSKYQSSTSPSSSIAPALLTGRPIATNSRVRQTEQIRSDMFLAFVNNALHEKLNGRSDNYDELTSQFDPKRLVQGGTQTIQLRLWITALSHVVSKIERAHSSLVQAIVKMPWTTMDNAIVKAFTVFFGMLLSAKPEYLSLVLGKVAQEFTYQSGLQALDSGIPEGSSSPLTRRTIYDRLHFLLQHILTLIPTLPSTLLPLLIANFPHKRQSLNAQTTYIRNLLRVTEYCPEVTDKILSTIVDRAIQIDVEIQVEIEELEAQENDTATQDVFELDPFDALIGDDDSVSHSDDEDEIDNFSDLSSEAEDEFDDPSDLPTNVRYIQDMVSKLDHILALLFEHFDEISSSPANLPSLLPLPSSPSSSSLPSMPLQSTPGIVKTVTDRSKMHRRNQFHTLLAIFDRTILRTFKSRYTQFILFWYTSLDPEFSDLFQGMLIERALWKPDEPAITRAAAASYVGSFVSRAQFVDRTGTRAVVGIMCNYLKEHLDAIEEVLRVAGDEVEVNAAENTVFYAIAQAVFLIFCFRWRDLLDEDDALDELMESRSSENWMPELRVLPRIINSILNPLKVCAPNVALQFARVAHATHLVYCYTLIEENKRSDYSGHGDLPSSTSKTSAVVMANLIDPELNSFFPFDPYKLPKSNAFIASVYRDWSSVAIGDDDEDENEDDEVESTVDVLESGGLPVPVSSRASVDSDDDTAGLGQSLNAMSISPAAIQGLAVVQ